MNDEAALPPNVEYALTTFAQLLRGYEFDAKVCGERKVIKLTVDDADAMLRRIIAQHPPSDTPAHTVTIDVVFDGPPDATGPRFIEVEDQHGASIKLGEWVERTDGYWVRRFDMPSQT